MENFEYWDKKYKEAFGEYFPIYLTGTNDLVNICIIKACLENGEPLEPDEDERY